MSNKICPRCKTKHTGKGERCDRCKGLRAAMTTDHKTTKSIYGSPRWKAVRRIKRARDPLCERCKSQGIIKPADMVDHIKEITDGGAPFDINNLMSLCWSCHAKKTARARKERAVLR